MDKLSLSSTPPPSISRPFLSPLLPFNTSSKRVSFTLTNPKKFTVFASQNESFDDNKLNQWDLMELKFGRMLGEDPQLTLAKIKGRKVNPGASYMDIEKEFYKNKGKMVELKEVPFDVPERRGSKKATDGLNLVKPVPKKGIKVGGGESNIKLPDIKRPNEAVRNKASSNGGESNFKLPDIKRPNEAVRNKASSNGGESNSKILDIMRPNEAVKYKASSNGGESISKLLDIMRPNEAVRNKASSNVTKSKVQNVILRRPSVYDEKDDEMNDSSRLKIKPNLTLSMRTEPVKEKFSGMTLLKKPELSEEKKEDEGTEERNSMDESVYSELMNRPANSYESVMADESGEDEGKSSITSSGEVRMLEKPRAVVPKNNDEFGSSCLPNRMDDMMEDHTGGSPEPESDLISKQDGLRECLTTGMQHLEQTDTGFSGNGNGMSRSSSAEVTGSGFSADSVLMGKPKRLDQSAKELLPNLSRERTVSASSASFDGEGIQEELPKSQDLTEAEEAAWTQVEQLSQLGTSVFVELISCSPRGFVVSYGSLIGFLPYHNLVATWKFLAFESWLRKNGLDPFKYRQHLSIRENNEVPNHTNSLESSPVPEISQQEKLKVSHDMELEDLLKIYNQEKIEYLSSSVGQRTGVNILLADRKSRKLIFSMRLKEKEENIVKKRSVMTKLSVGDVVKCCITKITYFGIFVEVEGVPALIHQTEVSWDCPLDPTSYFKIGQIVEAKVQRLDFFLERIFLSLKEITPDPLNKALECIVGSNVVSGGSDVSLTDSEWAELDSLVKELQAIDGVLDVTKGRFFLSPGLAPTFQVYMAPMFENQYKLLARDGNKVQELMVQASLDKEEMKSTVLKCTNNIKQ